MTHRQRATAAIVTAILSAAVTLSAACGSASSPDPASETTPDAPRAAIRTPAAGETILTLVAKNIKFDAGDLNAPAGTVTFVIDNEDRGVPHNLHVYRGKNAKGDSIDKTKLENGPRRQELTLTLDAGQYFFLCDAHPNMKGDLTIES